MFYVVERPALSTISRTSGKKRMEHAFVLLIDRDIVINVEEFFTFDKRVASIVIKLIKMYRLKIYKPTYRPLAKDSRLLTASASMPIMKKANTRYTIVVGRVNAKVGKKQIGERRVMNFAIGIQKNRGDTLVRFAEINNLTI